MKRKKALSIFLSIAMVISLIPAMAIGAAAATPSAPELADSAAGATGGSNSFFVAYSADTTYKNRFTLTFTYSGDLDGKLEYYYAVSDDYAPCCIADVPASGTPTDTITLPAEYSGVLVGVRVKASGGDTASDWANGLYTTDNISPFGRCIDIFDETPLQPGMERPTQYDPGNSYFSTCPITWELNGSAAAGAAFAPGMGASTYTAKIQLSFVNAEADAAGLTADAFKVQGAESTTYDPANHVITAIFLNYVTDGNSLMAYRYGFDADNHIFSTFDLQGYFADAWKQVTYGDGGFETYLKTSADGPSISVPVTGVPRAIGDTGLTAAVSCSLPAAYDGKIIEATYTVHNTGTGSATYSLGSGADIQIGEDDSAAITPFSDGSGFKMVSSDSGDENADGEYAQLNFFCKSTRGVTDVDSIWYGPYNGEDSWYGAPDASGHHNVFRSLNDLTTLEDTDATMSYSWNNRNIGAGETQTYTVYFGIGGAGSENVVSGLFDNLTSSTGTVALHQSSDSPAASFQASDITVKVGGVSLTQDTGYTLSGLDTASPSVTFLEAAGLTSKSVVTITAAGINGGNPITLKNTIAPDTAPPAMTGLTVNFTDSTSISVPPDELTQTMSSLTCGTGKTVQNITIHMSEPVKLAGTPVVKMQGASGECKTMIPADTEYGTISLSAPVGGYSSVLTITPGEGNGQTGYTGSVWFGVNTDSVEDTSGNGNALTCFRLNVTDSSVAPAANGGASAGVTPASGTITGTQTFTFSFGSSAGKMKQLSLAFFFGSDWSTGTNWQSGDDWTASDTQNPADNMVEFNLPVSEAGVLDTDGLVAINDAFKGAAGESSLSGIYSENQIMLYKAMGFEVGQDNLSAVESNIAYAPYSGNTAGVWTIKLDTTKLTSGKLTMLASVTDSADAVWGENDSGINKGADTKAYQHPVNPHVYANGVDIIAGGYWKNSDTTAATGSASDYNFHFDPATYTLYLNNANITKCVTLNNSFQRGCYDLSGDSGMYGIYTNCVNLNIVLTGTSTITPPDTVNDFSPYHDPDNFTGGVCVQNGNLTISGSGTLTVSQTASAVFVTGIAVNQNGNLYMTGGTVNATGYFGAINAYHDPYADHSGVGTPANVGCINLSGGTVNARAVGEGHSFAFACNGDVNITGSAANVTADALYGIYSNNGVINIEKGHNIAGDAAHFAPGQTWWPGSFFGGYGCIHVVNGVLTRATANYPIKFVYGDGESDYTTILCALGDNITLPTGITKDGYTLSWYTGENGTGTQVTGNTGLTSALLNGENTLTLYANWTKYTPGAPSAPGEGGNTKIIVDGVSYDIGTASSENGRTTVTPSQTALDRRIGNSAQGGKVEIPVALGSGAASGAAGLVLKNVADMADKGMTLSVQVGNVSYNLPAASVNTSAVMDTLGARDSSDVKFTVTVTQLSDSDVTVQNGELVLPPVEFTVTASYNGQSTEVSQFSNYVDRVIAIPDGVDHTKITTAVVIDANGNERHIPTEVFVGLDGKYYARVNSLTNSVYVLVWHPMEFSDVTGHWAKDSVNDMGSRMVLNGIGNNNFDPDRNMTRAEFAATMVRALGLAPVTGTGRFSDVASSDWYCGYVATAAKYGVITGYPDGTFGPNDSITREQAMTIMARAMKITKLGTSLAADKVRTLLAGYSDGASASAYADESIAACVSAGIVSGRSGNTIAPQENITRAEVAVMVERLLQKSNLI